MPRRELGIKVGEVWAYQRGPSHPLIAVRIIDPGSHYYARIIIEPAKDGRWRESTNRAHLPCKWEQVDDYVALHAQKKLQIDREVNSGNPTKTSVPEPPKPLDGDDVYVLAKIDGIEFDRPIGYSVKSAAKAVGYSEATIRKEMAKQRLRARYANSKPIILYDELWRWANELPTWPNHEHRELR